jgi:hypothetical protein
MSARPTSKECRDCRHFRNDAAFLEDLFKGLTALSSADSSRADDGLCLLHQFSFGSFLLRTLQRGSRGC